MFLRGKKLLVSVAMIASMAMFLPGRVSARGGGGGGHGGGGGFGGGHGGFGGGGGFRGGFGGGYGGGYRGGYSGYSGGYRGGFNSGYQGGYNGGWNSGYRGSFANSRGNFGNATSAMGHVPAAPVSPRMNGGHFAGGQFNRNRFNNFGRFGFGFFPFGFGLGNYWGFGYPWWYGGFPFWYSTLGYGAYSNPYYDSNPYDYGNYNYGSPLPEEQNGQAPASDQYFAAARAAFYANNYPEALRQIEHAMIDDPSNQDVHEFHSLVLFALGQYAPAAAVAHTVLDAGPGWDWSILQSLYPSPEVYTQQLRALENYIRQHDDQASTRFLLADHYLMLGHLNAAHRQLELVVKLEPRDTLAKNILAGLAHAPGVQQLPPAPSGKAPTGPPSPAGQPATNAAQLPLVGQWKSQPAAGVDIQMNLEQDGHFTWTFSEGGQNQSFNGTYVRQGDDLILTRQDGQVMDGVMTVEKPNTFRFRLKNTGQNDPGLEFSK